MTGAIEGSRNVGVADESLVLRSMIFSSTGDFVALGPLSSGIVDSAGRNLRSLRPRRSDDCCTLMGSNELAASPIGSPLEESGGGGWSTGEVDSRLVIPRIESGGAPSSSEGDGRVMPPPRAALNLLFDIARGMTGTLLACGSIGAAISGGDWDVMGGAGAGAGGEISSERVVSVGGDCGEIVTVGWFVAGLIGDTLTDVSAGGAGD